MGGGVWDTQLLSDRRAPQRPLPQAHPAWPSRPRAVETSRNTNVPHTHLGTRSSSCRVSEGPSARDTVDSLGTRRAREFLPLILKVHVERSGVLCPPSPPRWSPSAVHTVTLPGGAGGGLPGSCRPQRAGDPRRAPCLLSCPRGVAARPQGHGASQPAHHHPPNATAAAFTQTISWGTRFLEDPCRPAERRGLFPGLFLWFWLNQEGCRRGRYNVSSLRDNTRRDCRLL